MVDELKSVPIPPVEVTVIGTGTGDGGAAPIPSGTVLVTPDHQPNVIYNVITPVVALLVRFINSYVGSLVGILLGAMGTQVITAPDFYHLLLKCAGLALAGPVIMSLKDVVTIFTGLEKKFPLLTGSV